SIACRLRYAPDPCGSNSGALSLTWQGMMPSFDVSPAWGRGGSSESRAAEIAHDRAKGSELSRILRSDARHWLAGVPGFDPKNGKARRRQSERNLAALSGRVLTLAGAEACRPSALAIAKSGRSALATAAIAAWRVGARAIAARPVDARAIAAWPVDARA